MKSFGEYRQELSEAKATYCGRCGTTHVPPSQGGTCPALKKEDAQLNEVAPGENLPGKATHLTNKDIRHPEHGIISGSTTLRHLGGNNYEVRAGRAKGKTIALDKQHVQKLSEEVELDEEIKKGDFVKDPHGKIHRVFDVKDNMLHTGEYRGKNTYGGTSMLHKTKAAKVSAPKDVTEDVELDESDLHSQFAAFAAARGGKVTTLADRKKATAELIAKREKEAAARPKPEPQKIEPYKPLGGRDEKSGRSYSEEVELDELNQMTLSRYAAKARVDQAKDRKEGVKKANRKLRFGEYSEMVDQQNEKQ